jgi:hypothetical protein
MNLILGPWTNGKPAAMPCRLPMMLAAVPGAKLMQTINQLFPAHD